MGTTKTRGPGRATSSWPRPQASAGQVAPEGQPIILSRPLACPWPGPPAALLFDTGDVLYDTTSWRRWLLQRLVNMGLYAHYRSFWRVWEREFLVDVHRGRRDMDEAFGSFLRSAGMTPAQIDEVRASCRARRGKLQAATRLLPGVRDTLGQLKAEGVVLGVLANADRSGDQIREQLACLGLKDIFVVVISSLGLGCVLPEPDAYRAALKAMELPAPEVAFVGHDAEELAGAAAVGMRTVAFNFDPQAEADVCLARFEQLQSIASSDPRRESSALSRTG